MRLRLTLPVDITLVVLQQKTGTDGNVRLQVVVMKPGDMRMFYHSFDIEKQRFVVGMASSKEGFRYAHFFPGAPTLLKSHSLTADLVLYDIWVCVLSSMDLTHVLQINQLSCVRPNTNRKPCCT